MPKELVDFKIGEDVTEIFGDRKAGFGAVLKGKVRLLGISYICFDENGTKFAITAKHQDYPEEEDEKE